MKKRPVTYKDWRNLWHEEAKWLGWRITWRAAEGRPLIDRETHRLIRRLVRIMNRLDVENEVMDRSWCEAMLEILRQP